MATENTLAIVKTDQLSYPCICFNENNALGIESVKDINLCARKNVKNDNIMNWRYIDSQYRLFSTYRVLNYKTVFNPMDFIILLHPMELFCHGYDPLCKIEFELKFEEQLSMSEIREIVAKRLRKGVGWNRSRANRVVKLENFSEIFNYIGFAKPYTMIR